MLTTIAQQLYQIAPDRLYINTEHETWYAFYDYDLCILTNGCGGVDAFCFDTKTEYRDVRRMMIEEYNIKQVNLDYVEDF